MNTQSHCPFCTGSAVSSYHRDRRRPYLQCGLCHLVFVPPDYRLARDAEKAEYDLHQNEVDDPGYRRFLARLADPLCEQLAPDAKGLDFGCGPGPALAQMLRERGFEVDLYDSFYQPDSSVFDKRYDFICATEVVEHLHHPGPELERLWSLLRPGGLLGVMTKLVKDVNAFANWHYKNDPTHVCFFSRETWQWWAAQQGVAVEFIGSDVILLRKH